MNYRGFNGEGALPIVPQKGVRWGPFPSRLNQQHQLPPLLCLPAHGAVPPPPHPTVPTPEESGGCAITVRRKRPSALSRAATQHVVPARSHHAGGG